ncbi:DNA internalization-related competence protein ComEC/Rec2 [Methylomonas rapida]|uniref:DNA internalization-related competence protein ComEC/Rec2 n=1 Tax=Methylomonas rapida TaxID=2963939 RepID=A0ABY7GN22_9GAMM|nr:DNA internalization-related competence protein ComEC/Rec2 [Methylomonas rapida]WAR45896.1 DNA internalization-related competence protein ComEC/Rec2 [Methylomonas rapida]
MYRAVLTFLAGIAWVQHWSRLPSAWEWLFLTLLAAAFHYARFRLGWVLILGVLWASLHAGWRLSDRLAGEWQGKDVPVQGYIVSLPQRQEQRVSFDFYVTESAEGIPRKLRLNWYSPKPALRAGQAWALTVRLKQPHGLSNPGAFDYEAWLFANRIGATGYVRPAPPPWPIKPPLSMARYLAQWRQAVSDKLDAVSPHSQWNGVIKALTIGRQDEISRRQWDVFRASGIVHLVVISGSHITLIAGLVFWLTRRLWVWLGILGVSPQTVAAASAWLAAGFYAGLAGFSIPTQRAMLMLTVGLCAIVLQRNIAAMRILLLALLLVVLFDPLALLAVGFWLSFAAVAILMYVSSARLGRPRYWRDAGKVHVAMAIGLSPLLLVFFQQVSLISPVANALAVPLVGLVITPMALLAVALTFVSPALVAGLLWSIDKLLQALWWLLQQMAAWPLAQLASPEPPWYAVLMSAIGAGLLLAPKGLPGRYLSPFLFLPLAFVSVEKPKPGEIWLTLLDVGQGLSTVVQTSNHVLVFDTGAKYSEQFDMGDAVLLPYLRHQGINRIDALVLSHDENDHSGGAETLLAEMPVTAIYSSAAHWTARPGGQYCRAGQRWQWDGVGFNVLSPTVDGFASENDNSCVLKIGEVNASFLLTGDIEHDAEQWLVRRYGPELASTVMIAPHHGSKTSSHDNFLSQVDPELILIPAGYANRFGFPHPRVLQRYKDRHIQSLTTGEDGAITVKIAGESVQVEPFRQSHKRYWMRP